ncbi:MAG: ankyrin repeat domain-containing protein [Alphaproteobacteria bacterium]
MTASPLPQTAGPLRASSQAAEWASVDGASPPWLLDPVRPDDLARPSPVHATKLRIALFCFIGLHFAAATLVVAGLPHVNLDWLKLRDAPIKRVDVVFYDPIAAEEVAPGTGAVAQEQGHFGQGSAEQRGRDVGRNPTQAQADVIRPNARRVAQGQVQAGDGEAAVASTATKAAMNHAASAKSDSAQSGDGKDTRTEKAATARAAQHPSKAAAAAQTATPNASDAKPGGAGSSGQPDGKGKDDRTGSAQKQPARESESGQQSAAAPAAESGTSPSRPSPLAASLPILDRQDRGKPKQEAQEEPPALAVVSRLQTDEAAPQQTTAKGAKAQPPAPDSAAKLQERLRDLREKGGPSDLKVAANAPAGEPLLPATGTGTSSEAGAASGAPATKTSDVKPIRAAQAMPPAPAETSSNVAMKLMLQTMPGLDSTLAASMAKPDTVPVLPPNPRREQVVARMQKAASQGYAHAQYGVARRELIGQGVPRDPKAAAALLESAARQGHAMSQLTLGYMALKGYGVKQDKTEALLWLTMAANQGNEDAARAAALVEPTLTARELVAARRSISEWKAVMGDATPPAATEGKAARERGPLQDAIAHGDVAAIRALVARGEDANGRDREGRTAMINAGWRGDSAIVDSLLEMGADPDIVDNEGRTAIMWAAGNGYPAAVERLIKAGVELDLKDKDGRTAITSAALNGHAEVVKALVAGKANLDIRDDRGKTALDYALRQNYPDVVQILEKAGAKR